MLAGCSSSALLSPRHRLRSEASSTTQFQACHFPSMSTQRLDLPCNNFPRTDPTSRSQQPIRSVGLSIENKSNPITCSLKQKREQSEEDEFFDKGKSLKRRFAADQSLFNEDIRAKKKRSLSKPDECFQIGDYNNSSKFPQLGSGSFWFQPISEGPKSFSIISGLNTPQIPFSLSSSGDDDERDRVCFVPGDLISPFLPIPNNRYLESVITEITELGDRKSTETASRVAQEPSGSSSSSDRDSHSLTLKLNENPLGPEIGNGSGQANHPGQESNHSQEEDGFELVSLLVACVQAIGSKNIAGISHFLAKLGDLSNPRGMSSISRLTSYFTESLALRVSRIWPHIFHLIPPRELDRDEDCNGNALRLLNQISPIPKFIHFTSNELFLRAFEGKDRVHIIDFDVKQGLQWPSLFQSLSTRSNPPIHVRITGIGESKQDLIETGDRLARFSEALNLPFEFHPVVDRLEDLRLWMLHVKDRETVAVNCIFQLHKLLYDSTKGALRDFLRLIRSTNPSIVVLGEQESEHNGPNFESRLTCSMKYYSAIFDSIHSTSLVLDSPVRVKIEDIYAREIRNIIACEGNDRVERHEGFEKWKALMEQGGFRKIEIGERELVQSKMILKMFDSESFRVEKRGENGDGITLNWLDQPLYTISAWKPIDDHDNIGGSSSSFFQTG